MKNVCLFLFRCFWGALAFIVHLVTCCRTLWISFTARLTVIDLVFMFCFSLSYQLNLILEYRWGRKLKLFSLNSFSHPKVDNFHSCEKLAKLFPQVIDEALFFRHRICNTDFSISSKELLAKTTSVVPTELICRSLNWTSLSGICMLCFYCYFYFMSDAAKTCSELRRGTCEAFYKCRSQSSQSLNEKAVMFSPWVS